MTAVFDWTFECCKREAYQHHNYWLMGAPNNSYKLNEERQNKGLNTKKPAKERWISFFLSLSLSPPITLSAQNPVARLLIFLLSPLFTSPYTPLCLIPIKALFFINGIFCTHTYLFTYFNSYYTYLLNPFSLSSNYLLLVLAFFLLLLLCYQLFLAKQWSVRMQIHQIMLKIQPNASPVSTVQESFTAHKH